MITKVSKLLVVDDNIDYVNFIRRALDAEDYKLSIALDGNTAIEKAAKENPDLVLLDLKLPDLGGEEVLGRMKQDNKDITVVVITGYGDDQVAMDMMKKGAVDFLTKPIEPQILIKAVKNALEIREAQQEDKQLELYPSLDRFFPFFAHEIRNPLHAISGALTIIQRRSNLGDEVLAQSINIISEEIQHLNEFVQECLNFVRPPNKVRFVEVDINEVIRVVINIIAHIFEREANTVRVVTEMDPSLPKIYSNYEEIKQAFLNIVKNAYEAMPKGGDLIIRTVQKSDSPHSVEIVFADTGVGIKKEAIPSLFDPFFTTKPLGTGLGLAMCRRIIAERNNGKILIDSEEGKGTTVIVKLPVDHPSEASTGMQG